MMLRQPTHGASGRSLGTPTVVELSGELDYVSAAPTNRRLDPVTAGMRPHLVLDLDRVDFLDCGGIAVLCRARRRIREHGGRLALVVTNPHFRWILRTVGLGDSFDILDGAPQTTERQREPVVSGAGRPPAAPSLPQRDL
ncbi:STAS domain-containing protein [Streptomyces inhibens]|uniref:STAS domain-containing protein n=1 Tax=Streptomyces inhibens TaxID=2293571 RepID=UPI003680394A